MITKMQSSSEIMIQNRNSSDVTFSQINQYEDALQAAEAELKIAAKFK